MGEGGKSPPDLHKGKRKDKHMEQIQNRQIQLIMRGMKCPKDFQISVNVLFASMPPGY